MATKSKSRAPAKRPVRHPKQQPTAGSRWGPWLALGVGLLALAVVAPLTFFNGSAEKTSTGLPNTSDYHSLLVNPSDSQQLVLGTHNGLYMSSDGGRHWRFDALGGNDAMNLARPAGDTIWLAGHNVFKKSNDGGLTWSDVDSSGLPSLDIHGFAADPRNRETVYAAVAGRGLYRSSDGGDSFSQLSEEVGGSVMALAVTPDGRLLAGDMQQGLLESRDDGATWNQTWAAQLTGLVVSPNDSHRMLATGAGIALSTDGGETWRSVLDLPNGAGPVAWSISDSKVAYVVGFDRTLWRSADAGATWKGVPSGEGG